MLKISISKQNLQINGKNYPISTAKAGISSVEDSGGTPVGEFIIMGKFGAEEPIWTIFQSRKPVGVWDGKEIEEDLILSRILTLDGCERSNANTLQRHIYIHGTNQESMLGTPVSHGCMRMSKAEIIELFDLVEIGETVIIKEDDG